MNHAANDQFANASSAAEGMATGMVDDVDLWMLAEATGDLYAMDGFFGFDPYGGKKPEDLTIWSRDGFLPPTKGPAHYELRFPYLVRDNGQMRRLQGPPQRVLVAGPAPNAVELSFSSDGTFPLNDSQHGESRPTRIKSSSDVEVAMLKIAVFAAGFSLAAPALADVEYPVRVVPAEYPVCTAKITDNCIEKKAIAKPVRHKAAPSKVVRRDKVHRRKG